MTSQTPRPVRRLLHMCVIFGGNKTETRGTRKLIAGLGTPFNIIKNIYLHIIVYIISLE